MEHDPDEVLKKSNDIFKAAFADMIKYGSVTTQNAELAELMNGKQSITQADSMEKMLKAHNDWANKARVSKEEKYAAEHKTAAEVLMASEAATKSFRTGERSYLMQKKIDKEMRAMIIEKELLEHDASNNPSHARFDHWADSNLYSSFNEKFKFSDTHKIVPSTVKLKPEERIMANKFLPFIVDKSTPEHIYHTLLSRSKGMNIMLVTSIFYMVMDKGLSELREFVKRLPGNLSVSQMYEEMVGKYPHYQIMSEDLTKFLLVKKYLGSHDWHECASELTKDLDSKDILAFLYVAWKMAFLEDYTTLKFNDFMEKRQSILSNLQDHIKFSDTGWAYEFEDKDDLECFIAYHTLLKSAGEQALPGEIKITFAREADDAPRKV